MLATGVLGAADDPWIRWDWISGHVPVIRDALAQHLELTLIAVAIGLIIALPLGVVGWRERILRGPIFSVTGILYTIPSLALFSILVPFTGLTTLTAQIGLVSYTLLILIRTVGARSRAGTWVFSSRCLAGSQMEAIGRAILAFRIDCSTMWNCQARRFSPRQSSRCPLASDWAICGAVELSPSTSRTSVEPSPPLPCW